MPILQPEDFQNLTAIITDEELHTGILSNKIFNSTNSTKLLQILRGPLNDNKHYEGKMTFEKCMFNELDLHCKEIHNEIYFKECLFVGRVNCAKTKFHKDTIFKRCVFQGKVNFNEATLGSISDFSEMHLLENGLFSCIGKKADACKNYRDYSKLFFDNAVLEGPVKFSFYNFPQYTSFTEANFSNYFAFDCVRFSAGTSFQGTKWECINNDSLNKIHLLICFRILRISLQQANCSGIMANYIQEIENELDEKTVGNPDIGDEIGKIYTSKNLSLLPDGKRFIKKSSWLRYSGWDTKTYNVMACRNPTYFVRLNIGKTQYLELEPLRKWVMEHQSQS